jgi:peptidoglycan/LPS O-acetylase OafA/YrhL
MRGADLERRLNRIPELDAVRGIAAALVFIHHAQLPGLHPATIGLDVGVMLFYALSGYLLYAPFAEAHFTDRRVATLPYLVRRAFRIYPAYLVAVVGGALIYGWRPQSVIGVITMADTPIVVAWTLRIELGFYLFLPVLAVGLARLAPRVRLRALLLLAVASLAIGAVELALTFRVPTDAPAWLFAFVPGMVIGELQGRRSPRLASLGRLPWLTIGILLLLVSAAVDLTYLDLPAAIGSALVVAWCLAAKRLGALGTRVAVTAGAVSYGVYLWHVPIIDLLSRPSSWAGAAIALAVTLAIAGASYVLVEAPSIRIGQRIAVAVGPSRQRAPATPSVAEAAVSPPERG